MLKAENHIPKVTHKTDIGIEGIMTYVTEIFIFVSILEVFWILNYTVSQNFFLIQLNKIFQCIFSAKSYVYGMCIVIVPSTYKRIQGVSNFHPENLGGGRTSQNDGLSISNKNFTPNKIFGMINS